MKNERIVLCRPYTGLNDMLGNMECCYRYCKKNKRKLYVDGAISGFLDDLSHYFIPLDNNISFKKVDFLQPPFDVFPNCLNNDLYNYGLKKEEELSTSTSKGRIILTFDFKKNYKEQILVHAEGGSKKDIGLFMFTRFKLKEEVKLHIKKTIDDIKSQSGKNKKYDAIHVRNTDFKTDYKSYFNNIKNKINKTTVLCTDDYGCQQYAKNFFDEKLKIVTDIPDLSAFEFKNLHHNKDIDRYKNNVDTLTDLFILACAERVYYAPIDCGYYINDWYYVKPGTISGFQKLSKRLHDNKRIIKNMLYRNKNNILMDRLTLCECYVYFIILNMAQKFHRLTELIENYGIFYTINFIYNKLIRRES